MSSTVSSAPVRAAAAPDSITIDVRDYALVARVPMTAAARRLEEIFQTGRLPVRLTVDRQDSSSPQRLAVASVTVIVYPRLRGESIASEPNVLGWVPGGTTGGRIAYVFASRIEDEARRHGVDYGRLLGTVLAHEVGHVLLPGRPHASAGLMRAVCDAKQIRQLIVGGLEFTAEETAVIRKVMLASH